MRIVRYLNGKPLKDAMPQLCIKDKCVSSVLCGLRQNIPLRNASGSAILYPEGSGSGKDVK